MLAINIVEIQTDKDEVAIYKTAYSDRLKEYRINYPTYSFYRLNDDIFAWKNIDTEELLPTEFAETIISKDNDTLVFKEILEQSLITFFKSKEYDIFQKKYSSIWEFHLSKVNPIALNGMSLLPKMEFEVNTLYSTIKHKPVISLSIRKTYKPKFTYSETEFLENNIDIRNWDRNNENEIIVSPKNRKKFLEATRQTEIYKTTLDKVYTLSNEYKEFNILIKGFNSYKDSLYLPDNLKVTNFFFSGLPNLYFKDLIIDKPNYYFLNNRTGFGYYNKRLKELKPYSFDNLKKRAYKIIIFTPSVNEGTAGSFIKYLQGNLNSNFHANNIEIDLIKFERDTSLDFINNLVNKADEGNYDLAITILAQIDKKLPIKTSPYFLLKAKLLGRKIPTQQLTIETIRKINYVDDQVLNAIALNIYSKLGGTAWTIEKDEKERVEIIIGIGSTVNFAKQRIIGFANVFDYKGAYLIGSSSQISNLYDYSKSLEKHLVETIKTQIELKGIETTDDFRIIFHLSKPASKKHEIKAINNALNLFKSYKIQYAIVHLSYQHNYRLFSSDESKPINRGTYVEIASRQALLHLGQNSKVPILLRIDKRSIYENTEAMYKDLYAIAKQVLFFSHLSFRTFKPANIPVTIQYPQLMAKLSSELMIIDDWDKSNLEIVKNKLWFI